MILRNQRGQFIKGNQSGKRLWSLEDKIKMSEKIHKIAIQKGFGKWMKGKRHSNETKEKLRKAHAGENAYFYGKHLSEEAKKKISEAKKKNPTRYWLGKKRPDLSGEKCNLWNGGTNTVKNHIRKCSEYKNWRKRIFERDNYTCVFCNAKNGSGKSVYLEADHYPTEFMVLIKKFDINSYKEAVDCSALWDINNGRTLCRNCHKKTKKGNPRIYNQKCLTFGVKHLKVSVLN
jgi:5-methylcytosine-specific restriction endonuclease McrA